MLMVSERVRFHIIVQPIKIFILMLTESSRFLVTFGFQIIIEY